jgi:hypothetical protein
MNRPGISLTILACAGMLAVSHAETRTFIDQTGRALAGELVSVSGTNVTIKRASDGQTFTVPTATFSRADQAYIAGKGGAGPAVPATAAASSTRSAAVAPATGSSASTTPFRIDLRVYPNKNDKAKGGYYDERIQRISYKIDLRNGEQQRDFGSGKVIMLAVAKNLQDSGESQLVVREEFPVDLKAMMSQSVETKETKITYDDIYYKYGYKYSGYVCVLKDQAGKTVSISGSTPGLEKGVDDLLKLKVGDVFDKNYKLVESRTIRNS